MDISRKKMNSRFDFTTSLIGKTIKIRDYQNYILSLTDDTDSENKNHVFSYPRMTDALEQEWIIYPIDGSKFLLVNKYNGYCLQEYYYHYGTRTIYPTETSPYSGDPAQHWTIENLTSELENLILRNAYTGDISLTAKETSGAIYKNDLTASVKSDIENNNLFTFEIIKTIPMPKRPTLETLDPYPRYQSDSDNLLEHTPPRLTGWTLIPAPMVKDNKLTEAAKIQNHPYYILKKYQYWKEKKPVTSLEPGASKEKNISYNIDSTNQKEIDNTLGITINKDLGFNFSVNKLINFGYTYDIKEQLSQEMSIHESKSTELMESYTDNSSQRNPSDEKTLTYTKYTLVTEFVLKRILLDQIDIIDDTKDPHLTILTYQFEDPQVVQTTSIFE